MSVQLQAPAGSLRSLRRNGWLELAMPLITEDDPGQWLHINQGLGGFAKLARLSEGSVELRAEIPLGPEPRLNEHIAGARAAFGKVFGDDAQGDFEREHDLQTFEPILEELNRPFRRSSEGELTVVLSLGLGTVELDVTERWALRAKLPAISISDWCPTSRKALHSFLMRSNGCLRLARASSDDSRAWFEVCFELEPDARELDYALTALEVAARFHCSEARSLVNERVSRLFLEWNP